MFSSIETVTLCQILEQSENLRKRGYRKCHYEHPLGVYLVGDKFVHLASDTSSLCHILKQLDNYSWVYRI